MSGAISITVQQGNALAVKADVLALKYAQQHYGLDGVVAVSFSNAGRALSLPEPWDFRIFDGVAHISARKILFVGVPELRAFEYKEIRRFARTVTAALAQVAPDTRHLLLTVHGAGYGLDELEAFESELAGILDAVRSGDRPPALEKITVIEKNPGRARRLKAHLETLFPEGVIEGEEAPSIQPSEETEQRLDTAGRTSDQKAHVFVAMPFKEEMDDVYHYGIHGAVRAAGFLCERADLSTFTGDIIAWVRNRIQSASFVVADLTDPNPNVYLEVGYAWGCGIPTILLVRDIDDVPFDVRGQRFLLYRRIKDLEESLAKLLRALAANDQRQ